MTSLRRCSAALAAAAVFLLLACDGDPEMPDAAIDSGPIIDVDSGPEVDGAVDSGGFVRPDAGPECAVNEDCDDEIECTNDRCSNGRCQNIPENAVCEDGVHCNGVEICDALDGCVPGPRVTCNDDDVCTVDRCIEAEAACHHEPRDLDRDGDPDFFCEGGGDCDDRDPLRSSLLAEVCADGVDNDCDDEVDEPDCGRPRYDTCDDPLDVTGGGAFLLHTVGANPDYEMSCRSVILRDLVITFELTQPRSVAIVAEGEFFNVGVSLRETCGEVASEIDCRNGFPGAVSVGSLDPGVYYVVLAGSSDPGQIALDVRFGEPVEPPANDTCASPIDVSAGGTFTGSFIGGSDDLTTSCNDAGASDVVYTFTTTEAQDVTISARSTVRQNVAYSLRSTCGDGGSEVRCAVGDPATGTFYSLAAGTYFLVLESPASRDVAYALDVSFDPPTEAPEGDTCAAPLPLTQGTTATGSFLDLQDDLSLTCGRHQRDVVYTFDLAEASDVVLELDTASRGWLSLRSTCETDAGDSGLRCSEGSSPMRRRIRNAPAGTYYVVAESDTGGGYSLDLTTVTPPTELVEVSGNEDCSTGVPHDVPATGGLFHGNTSGMTNDYTAACLGSGMAESADAVYRLMLTETKRVILSTADSASDYNTVLHVHEGSCQSDMELVCDVNSGDGDTSYIDRNFDPGTYFIIVDGFGTSSAGEYVLEVAISDP